MWSWVGSNYVISGHFDFKAHVLYTDVGASKGTAELNHLVDYNSVERVSEF